MKTPSELANELWDNVNEHNANEVEFFIKSIQIEAWNEAIDAATEYAKAFNEPVQMDNNAATHTMYIISVYKQSILKLNK